MTTAAAAVARGAKTEKKEDRPVIFPEVRQPSSAEAIIIKIIGSIATLTSLRLDDWKHTKDRATADMLLLLFKFYFWI